MERNFFRLILFALILMTASTAFAKESPEQLRAKLDNMSEQVLQRMYAKYPDAETAVKNSYAYCTISSSSVNWGFFGSDRGRGLAYNRYLDKKVYVKMNEAKLGLSIGAKEYDLLFIIQSQEAWERFISGSIKFGTEVSAQASDGVTSDTFVNATVIANGVWVYQLDKKGLALELSFKGAQITPYKTLN